MWGYSPRSPPSCVLGSSSRGSVLRYMRVATPEHTVSVPDLLRTAICEQIVTSIGKFITDKALYPPDAFHEHASHPTYLPRFFSSLAKGDFRPRICYSLSTMPRQKVKILRNWVFHWENFSREDWRCQAESQIKRRWKSIGVPHSTLSSCRRFLLKDKRSGMGLRDTWALSQIVRSPGRLVYSIQKHNFAHARKTNRDFLRMEFGKNGEVKSEQFTDENN